MRLWRQRPPAPPVNPPPEPPADAEIPTRVVTVDLGSNQWYDTSPGPSGGYSLVVVPHCHQPGCQYPVIFGIVDPDGDGVAGVRLTRVQLPSLAGQIAWLAGPGPDYCAGAVPDTPEGIDRAGV